VTDINPVTEGRSEAAACPAIGKFEALELGELAAVDALDLIADVHDIDPRQVYGRLTLWARDHPQRLVTAAFALAAFHDPETPGSALERNVLAARQPEAYRSEKETAA
jgi:hypothetical protein